MKEETIRGTCAGFARATGRIHTAWININESRLMAGIGSIALSLALAACGGDGGIDSVATPATKAAAPVEAAASAVSSKTVSLAMSLKMNSSALTADAQTERFIIKYKNGTPEQGATSAVQTELDKLATALPAKAHHLRRMGIGSDVVTTERALNTADAKAFMRAIASDPNVEYVEPDAVATIGSSPNDPLYGKQWALSSNQTPGTTTPGIRAEGAWDLASGAGVVIGVVDSGITRHSELNANVLPGYDFTGSNRGGDGTQPGNMPGENCSITWHGTHIAGIMAAATNNGVGIAGIAPAAKLVSARTITNCNGGFISDIADGITWVAGGTVANAPVNPNPAKVINVSLYGKGACLTSLQNAIDYATGKGAIVVAIAGNYGTDASNVQPANCRNVITVGAINTDSSRWVDSDFGPIVDIAAPGTIIWSTYNNGTTSPGAEGYGILDGTSQAAPMVSGVAALVQSIAPKPLTVAEMRALMQQNVQPFTQKPDQPIGAGILDATATVKAAKAGKIPAAADFNCTESTALMQVTCTDLSTSRGASISSWAWNLGTGGADMIRTQSVNAWSNYDYPGTYQISLKVTDSTGAVSTLTRPFQVLPPTLTDLSAGVAMSISAKNGEMQNYDLVVPSGVKSLTFTVTPATSSQTAILDIRAGTPSSLHPDCESIMVRGGAATCTISNPTPGTYYAIVSANTKLSDVSLLASYTQ